MKGTAFNKTEFETEAMKAFSMPKFIGSEYLAGLTFGIKESEIEAPDTATAVIGLIANIAGGLTTSAALFTGLGELGFGAGLAAKAVQAGSKLKLAKELKALATATGDIKGIASAAKGLGAARKVKLAAETARIGAEAVVVGGPVGAIRSVVRGEDDPKEILKDTAVEIGLFTLGGLALLPVAKGLGALSDVSFRPGGKESKLVFGSKKGLAKRASAEAMQEDEAVLKMASADSATTVARIKAKRDYVKPDVVEKNGTFKAEVGKAHVWGQVNGDELIITSAVTLPEARRQGLFTNLLSSVAAKAKERFPNIKKVTGLMSSDEAVTGRKRFSSTVFDGDMAQTNIDEIIRAGNKALTPMEAAAMEVMEKIEKSGIEVSPIAQLLANPAMLNEVRKDAIKTTSENLFLKEGGGLHGLYLQNKSLRGLVDKGDHFAALDGLNTFLTATLKENKSLRELMAGPFANNSASLYNIVAERSLKQINIAKYPGMERNLVVDYLKNETKENALALQAASYKRVLGKFKSKSVLDPRLNTAEIDKLASDMLERNLSVLAGNKILPGSIGSLLNTESILKTAITFNKNYSRTLMESFADGVGTANGSFVDVPKELQQPVKAALNLKRIVQEKNDTILKRRVESAKVSEAEIALKRAGADADKIKLKKELVELKDLQKVYTTKLRGLNKQATGESNAMRGLTPEQTQQVDGYVAEIYFPGKGSRQSTQSQLGAFGADDNPKFLRKDTELADVMDAYMTSGQDIQPKTGFKLPFGITISNPRRQLDKDLGPNNGVSLWLVDRFKTREVALNAEKDLYMKRIKALEAKAGSEESALIQRFGEPDGPSPLLPDSEEFLALPGAMQTKIKSSVTEFNTIYSELIQKLNTVNRSLNHPEINIRGNYFTHFGMANEVLPDLLDQLSSGKSSKEAFEFLKNKFGQQHDYVFKPKLGPRDQNRIYLNFERARKHTEGFKYDAVGGLLKYLDPALERIHYSDMVRELDSARMFAPPNLKQFLQTFKERYLLRRPGYVDQDTGGLSKKILKASRRRMAEGALFWNVNTMLLQLQSAPLSLSFGLKESGIALKQMFTKQGRELASQSKNLAMRSAFEHAVDKQGMYPTKFLGVKEIPKTAAAAYQHYKNFGKLGLEVFDRMAAKLTFLTGYNKGIGEGLTHENAIRFGDHAADLVHADMSKVGMPNSDFYQSQFGKAFTQFQSFVINYASTVMHDLPQFARTDGSVNAVLTLMKTYAGISLANETMRAIGAPAPYDIESFIPFMSSYRGAPPGYGAAVFGFAKAVAGGVTIKPSKLLEGKIGDVLTGDTQMSREGLKNLKRLAWTLAVPGGGQAYKTWQAIQDDDAKINAYFFGPGRVKYEEKEKKKEKKSFLNRTRKKIKEGLFN